MMAIPRPQPKFPLRTLDGGRSDLFTGYQSRWNRCAETLVLLLSLSRLLYSSSQPLLTFLPKAMITSALPWVVALADMHPWFALPIRFDHPFHTRMSSAAQSRSGALACCWG
jgi:hypothetical protein